MLGGVCIVLAACNNPGNELPQSSTTVEQAAWLAGDHHVHSEFSVEWDKSENPPTPVIGGKAKYSAERNARMGRRFGLRWIVVTDHGGPDQSELNRSQAYPKLVRSRAAVPDVLQYYGMEFETPGAKHSTVILPRTDDEADRLYDIDRAYGRKDAFPEQPSRDTEDRMLEALAAMRKLPHAPVVIANHPSRTAVDLGAYGLVSPRELRAWNDVAPSIAIGMEGAPGHQASALNPNGSVNDAGFRGNYDEYPTLGGFDQMTARLGGFWDSMLGEGRHWWITSTSDSHTHYSEGDRDFWPGEYSKTYVYADATYDAVLQGFRNGHVFVTTGDLISELYVTAASEDDDSRAAIGDTLRIASGSSIRVTIRFLDPAGSNNHDDNPSVARVDLIIGLLTGPSMDRTQDSNPTTHVVERFAPDTWKHDGSYTVATFVIKNVTDSTYLRVRGTNGNELEPEVDPPGEDPWTDLWFYSNPIFILVE